MYQNVYKRSCASQKIGIDTPMIAKIMDARSATDLRFTPEMMPMGMPRSSQSTAAPIARTAVIGMRRASSSFTGMKPS